MQQNEKIELKEMKLQIGSKFDLLGKNVQKQKTERAESQDWFHSLKSIQTDPNDRNVPLITLK